MKKTFNYLAFFRDYLTKRYNCFVATTPEDIKACLDIRMEVFGDELNRDDDEKNIKYSPADPDKYDEISIHVACRDKKSDEIVGSVRITPAHHFKDDSKNIKAYRLDRFTEDFYPQVSVVSRLAVKKAHRDSPAGLKLASECYNYCLSHNYLISLIVCEPNFYPMYRRMGYVPIGKVTPSPFGGYRLPLYFVLHDYETMRNVHSPFLKVAKELDYPELSKGIMWAKKFQKSFTNTDFGYEAMTDSDEFDTEVSLFENMSEEAQDQIIKNAIKIDCNFGDVVIAKDAGDKNFGIVNQGALQVNFSDNRSLVIGEGEIFGEIAFLLNTPRSADIVAASDETEVVLFSLSAVQKIEDVEEQNVFWKNLARILARRILVSNMVDLSQ